jgi:pantothenate kinase
MPYHSKEVDEPSRDPKTTTEINAMIVNALDIEIGELSKVVGDHLQEDAKFKEETTSKIDELSDLISKISQRLDRKCGCSQEKPFAIGHDF